MHEAEALRGVGATALGTAILRAEESARPDRLFHDPFAPLFVHTARERAEQAESGADHTFVADFLDSARAQVPIRTRFIDDLIAHGNHGTGNGHRPDHHTHTGTQTVLLAAGLDARAYRLAWPEGVRLFEVDLPEVLAFKDEVLAQVGAVPRCARTTVPADLRQGWVPLLLDAGFDPRSSTLWITEGLHVYLTRSQAAELFQCVGQLSAAGSVLFTEYPMVTDSPSPALTALWRGGLGHHTPSWLRDNGWRPLWHSRADLAARYGRNGGSATPGYITATRIDAL